MGLTPSKGNNKIWRVGEVEYNPGDYAIHGEIQHPIGSGPRHIRIRGNVFTNRLVTLFVDRPLDNILYTLHELTSTLTLQEIPRYPNGTSQILSNVSIIP